MGCPKQDNFENEYLGLKSWFETCPAEMVFEYAFRLSVLLHEIACSTAYHEYIPWDADKNYGLESIPKQWGYSAYGGPTGSAAYIGSRIFWADHTNYMPPTAEQMHNLQMQLKEVADKKVLTVLYTLYRLTIQDFDFYASIDELTTETQLDKAEIEEALEHIPVTVKSENG